MEISRTVVINCAGMGNRLGLGVTKALLMVENKPLIIRHLEMLKNEMDIRIVVGYQAEKVISTVRQYRDDIIFVFNHNYKSTGAGASLALASRYANEYILSLNGDVIIHPDDMKKVLDCDYEFISGGEITSDEPWMLQAYKQNNKTYVSGIYKNMGQYEWNGMVHIHSDKIGNGAGYIFELIDPHLPLRFLPARTREIDTMNDYERAVQWVRNDFH